MSQWILGARGRLGDRERETRRAMGRMGSEKQEGAGVHGELCSATEEPSDEDS